jgi:hypothetical protein
MPNKRIPFIILALVSTISLVSASDHPLLDNKDIPQASNYTFAVENSAKVMSLFS